MSNLIKLSTISSKPLRWLWPGRIALGKVTLFLGPTGIGKSLLTLDMAARVSSGQPWPNTPNRANTAEVSPAEPNPAGGVLLLTGQEDLADTVCPRLAAAGANLERINVPPTDENQPLTLPENIPAIEAAIANTPDCRLVIIDPLSSYLPATSLRKQPPLQTILKPLADLAARTGVAIVAVMPIIQTTSRATAQRMIANLTAQAAPYSVWQLTAEQSADPAQANQHWLIPVRNNHAPPNMALAFQPQTAPSGTAQVSYSPCLGRPARESARPRPKARQPAKTRQANTPSFDSEFDDDPDPYEGIPSLHDYPEPMNLHPPQNRQPKYQNIV